MNFVGYTGVSDEANGTGMTVEGSEREASAIRIENLDYSGLPTGGEKRAVAAEGRRKGEIFEMLQRGERLWGNIGAVVEVDISGDGGGEIVGYFRGEFEVRDWVDKGGREGRVFEGLPEFGFRRGGAGAVAGVSCRRLGLGGGSGGEEAALFH